MLLPLLVTVAGAWVSWQKAWSDAERETAHTADAASEYVRRVFDNTAFLVEEAEASLRRLASPDSGDVLSIVHNDGTVLARSVSVPPGTRIAAGSLVMEGMRRNEARGQGILRSSLDGEIRLVAYQRVEGHPLFYVAAARSRGVVMRNWVHGVLPLLAAGLPAALALMGLTLLVSRKQMALARANERLEHNVSVRTAELADSERRSRLAQEAGQVGTWEWDLSPFGLSWSDACHRLHGTDPGKPVTFDIWRDGVHPDDWHGVEERLQEFLDGKGIQWSVIMRFIRPSDGEMRWITERGEVVRRPDGKPVRMLGITMDVTDQLEYEATLRESEERARMAVEAARMGTWSFDVTEGTANWSDRCSEILGDAHEPRKDMPLDEFVLRIHADDVESVRRQLDISLAVGSSGVMEMEYRVRAQDRSWRWVAVNGSVMMRDPVTGAARCARGVIQDITERKEVEARQRLLMREVDHRAKNAMAIVLAAVRLSDRSDVESYAEAIEGRVNAMARTHGLLAEARWTGADLRVLIRSEMASFLAAEGHPHAEGAPRAEVTGPPLMVDAEASQAFSMLLHEMATNATKYGALSARGGQVQISLTVNDEEGTVRLLWTETGGPTLPGEPTIEGFGSQIISMTVESQLDGEIVRQWGPSGLVCTITVPLERLVAVASAESSPDPRSIPDVSVAVDGVRKIG